MVSDKEKPKKERSQSKSREKDPTGETKGNRVAPHLDSLAAADQADDWSNTTFDGDSSASHVGPHDFPQPKANSEYRDLSSASLIRQASEGLRFELLPNITEDDDEFGLTNPFATLSNTGRYSRVILGQVVSAGGSVIRRVALKIQKDEYSEEAPFEGGESNAVGKLNNPLIEELWLREYRNLSLNHGQSTGIVALLDLFSRPDPRGRPTLFPPVLYCREKKAFFHPPCPKTGKKLRVCQDDQLLEQVNTEIRVSGGRGRLQPYSKSIERYLYSEGASREVDSMSEVRLYVRVVPGRRLVRLRGHRPRSLPVLPGPRRSASPGRRADRHRRRPLRWMRAAAELLLGGEGEPIPRSTTACSRSPSTTSTRCRSSTCTCSTTTRCSSRVCARSPTSSGS